jgi:GNAT superfamily N-acetyltransferase
MRTLPGGLELDDDRARLDLDAVHRFLSGESYWARGRARGVQERLVAQSEHVVGLYDGERQVGFARAVDCAGAGFVYLADVYVLPDYREGGLGVELVREIIENGPFADCRWILHTDDAHGLYDRFGFGPSTRLLERPAR